MRLTTLLNRVYDEIPAAPEMFALRALADSVKEFCHRTHAWQAPVADVFTAVGTAKYNLLAPEGTMVVAPLEVRVDGVRINPNPAEFHRRGSVPLPGVPRSFSQTTPSLIELDRPALAGAVITVLAALTLPLDATDTDIPDDILNEYGEAIAAGAKMRMVRQAGQPWFDPKLGALYSVTYYTAVNEAKRRVMTSLAQPDLQVEMHSW